jgi:hypothetical protein
MITEPTDNPVIDRVGEELRRAAAKHARTSRRRRRAGRLVPVAAAALALAIAAIVVLPGAGGPPIEGLNVVAQAHAALAPSDDEIVHLVITTESERPSGVFEPTTTEQWSATEPTRWRSASEISGVIAVGPEEGLDPDAEPVTDRIQQSYQPGEFRSYSERGNGLSVLRGTAADERARVPSALGLGDGDPVTELASMLASEQLRDAGTVQSEGRTVRRLVGMSTGVHADGKPRQVVFDVDPETYAPIAGSTTIVFGGDHRSVTRFEVQRYERLPLNDETARLLRIPTNSDTEVVAERGGADLIERGVCRRQPRSADVICLPPTPEHRP